MRKFTVALAAILMALSIPVPAKSQNNVWVFITTFEGVAVSWRWRQELRNQYISELKFENTNSHRVEIHVTAAFVCEDGSKEVENEQMDTIGPGATKGGQWAGYFWYPCGGTRPPNQGGFEDFAVKHLR